MGFTYFQTSNFPSKIKKEGKKPRDFSPLLDLLDVTPVTTTNFCAAGGGAP